jgi:hypothetical protein
MEELEGNPLPPSKNKINLKKRRKENDFRK